MARITGVGPQGPQGPAGATGATGAAGGGGGAYITIPAPNNAMRTSPTSQQTHPYDGYILADFGSATTGEYAFWMYVGSDATIVIETAPTNSSTFATCATIAMTGSNEHKNFYGTFTPPTGKRKVRVRMTSATGEVYPQGMSMLVY